METRYVNRNRFYLDEDWGEWSSWLEGPVSESVMQLLHRNPKLNSVTLTWDKDFEVQWRMEQS